jgi:WD40 repeat protein
MDKTITLWEIKSCSQLHTLNCNSRLGTVTFSLDGQILANSSFIHKTVTLWDTNTGRQLQTLNGYSGSIFSLTDSLSAEGHPGPLLHGDCDATPSDFGPQIYLSDDWVSLEGENLLWLPPEYRQNSSSAVKDATLALGYSDGRVAIIGFHTP